jgi:hypothetical protein
LVEEKEMAHTAELNFIKQQGFRDATPSSCELQYSALMFQPRVLAFLVAAALILQSAPLFLVLSALLWWNVTLPGFNPFDALYNRFLARAKGLPRLTPALAPRRFAQGMAASFMLGIGVSLLLEWRVAAWVLEGFLVFALVALILGRFCLGSYILRVA